MANEDIKFRLLNYLRQDINTLEQHHYTTDNTRFLETAIDFFNQAESQHVDFIFTPDIFSPWKEGQQVDGVPMLGFAVRLRLETSGQDGAHSSRREWTGQVSVIPLFTSKAELFDKCTVELGAAHACLRNAMVQAAEMLRDAANGATS